MIDTKRKSPETHLEKTKRQLGHIISDTDFYMNDGYKEFVLSMHNAIGTRKVTKKMEISMDKIVSGYKKWLNDDKKLTRYEKKEYVNGAVAKIYLIRTLLGSCGYTPTYIARSEYFLNSVEGFLKKSAKLSIKQRKALNQMYNRFKKKVESKGISNVQIEMK
tara:strand:+ start:1311 stop:1796 length:486 start_codon:yes stop_codon:yes gene_type:complete